MARTSEDLSITGLTTFLREIAAELGDPQDPIALYNTVVEICLERFHAEASSLYLEEPRGGTVNMVAGEGYSANIVGQARYGKKEGVTGHVWALGQPFKADSHEKLVQHPWHAGKMDNKQWKKGKYCWSLIAVPLMIGTRVFGVLQAENKKPEPTAFTDGEYKLLQTVASVVSLAVENARLAERSHTTVLNALQKTVADLSGAESYLPTTLYHQVVGTCREILGGEAASLFLESDDRATLSMVAGDGYSKLLVGEASYEPNEGVTGHVWATGTSIKFDDVKQFREHPWHGGKYDDRQWKGDQHCWSLIAVPLNVGGHVIGVLKVENRRPEPASFTVGEQRILETMASIVALSVQNQQSVRRLQEAGLLAYDYAHTSKGDLAVLSNSLNDLRRYALQGGGADVESILAVMDDVVRSMNRSSQEILSIARESRTKLEMVRLTDLEGLLKVRWARYLEQRQVTFLSEVQRKDASLVADRAMLFAILDNLVQNSVEAIATRQQRQPDYHGMIGLRCTATDDAVSLYICDDALGIEPQDQPKLFMQRFTTKRTGTGLGLTIVKRYVEANRGTAEYCERLPEDLRGKLGERLWKTVFRVSLPRGQAGQLYSVLVIDDQRTFYDYLRTAFARRPAFGDVDWAEDLTSAINLLRAKTYDVVVQDLWLRKPPQGVEAYSSLRTHGFDGVVVIVSGYQELLEDARRLEGVGDVLAKDNASSIPQRCEEVLLDARAQAGPPGVRE